MNENNDSKKRFDILLEKVINETASDDEFNELFKYLEHPDLTERFKFLKDAAEKGYILSFYDLGRAYINGEGCEKSFENGRFWLEKSIANGKDGNTILGDCYRLGIEIEKNYETAWEYYSHLGVVEDDETIDGFNARDILEPNGDLIDDIPADWWEFVSTKTSGDVYSFGTMSMLYKEDTDRWFFWRKKAADAGDFFAAKDMLDRTSDPREQIRYIDRLLSSGDDIRMSIDVAMKVVYGDFPFELQVKAGNVIRWNIGLLPQEQLTEDLEQILIALEDDSNDGGSEDYFTCSCCHARIPRSELRDDADDDECLCDECYFSGRFLEDDESESDYN